MLKYVLSVVLVFGTFQGNNTPKVGRVVVDSPLNSSVIFEYASIYFPEDTPLTEKALDCFRSKLQATGLFRDIQIQLIQKEKGNMADVNVTPTWIRQIKDLVIGEIALEGFDGLDKNQFMNALYQEGLSRGSLFVDYPVSKIKSMVNEAAYDIKEQHKAVASTREEKVSQISCRVTLMAPQSVRVVVVMGEPDSCN